MLTGYVVSDLHLFCGSSTADRRLREIEDAASRAQFFVFNGDTFDERWSAHGGAESTSKAAERWLGDLAAKHPDCQFHFIHGNHDCSPALIETLALLASKSPNLATHKYNLLIGDTLFLHGDAIGKSPRRLAKARRRARCSHPRKAHWHPFHDLFIYCGCQKLIACCMRPALVVRMLMRHLNKVDSMENAREIYFGHTHNAFFDYKYKGLAFHNTGSAIKGQRFALRRVLIK